MGVVIRRCVWLDCIVVVSGYCCKQVCRFLHTSLVPGYISLLFILLCVHITYPYSTCISSFFAAATLLVWSFKNSIFILVCNFCAIEVLRGCH